MRLHSNCSTCTCVPEPVAPLTLAGKVFFGVVYTMLAAVAVLILVVLYGVATMGTP